MVREKDVNLEEEPEQQALCDLWHNYMEFNLNQT